MRLLLDMGIAPSAAAALRLLGHDAEHLEGRRESRLADREIVCAAREERRIVVTHDLDFTDLLALSGATSPSVITFRLRSMRPDRVLARLVAVLAAQRDDLEAGAIVSVSEAFTRVRRLPITMSPGATR
jgi:predicted nuclease of predicted toxin-antitoxin system